MRLRPGPSPVVAAGLALWIAAAAAAAAQPAEASAPYPELLPPAHEAEALIDLSPAIRHARILQRERRADAASLRAGPGEWVAGVMTQQRTEATGQRFSEQEYQLGREFRLPGKYFLDRERARVQETLGEEGFRDAWHEAGRDLLSLWFGWLRAVRQQELARAEAELSEAFARQVQRRVEAGDAAPLDAENAGAAAGRARAQALEAESGVAQARRLALERFPELPLRVPARWPEPVLPEGPAQGWIDRIKDHNHEVEVGEAEASAARLSARRARQDRLPDPRLSLNFSSNLDQDRRVVGLEVSMPLGGARRRHAVAVETSRAERAQLQAEQVRRRVGLEAEDLLADAARLHERWQALSGAARQASEAARRTQRGQELGEHGVDQVLLARSRAGMAQLEAALAALDAHEASIRVRIDAHTLWTPGPQEEHHGDTP